MNFPNRMLHNWEWRVSAEQLANGKILELGEMTKEAGRT
jgi:4-alpha-glucanotransferase